MCFFGSLQEPAKKSINGINKTYSSPPVVEIKNKQFSVGFSVGFFFFLYDTSTNLSGSRSQERGEERLQVQRVSRDALDQ